MTTSTPETYRGSMMIKGYIDTRRLESQSQRGGCWLKIVKPVDVGDKWEACSPRHELGEPGILLILRGAA